MKQIESISTEFLCIAREKQQPNLVPILVKKTGSR